MKMLLSCCTLALLAGACIGDEPIARPDPIKDAQGRIVIYHGVSVSNTSKHSDGRLPWQTRDDFARLPAWGFNLVRYLVFWEAVEPVQGQYDEDYIAKTVERIGWLESLGIDVIIDFHQDLYAQRFGGNGFPDWTVPDTGLDFTWREPWALNYLEPAVAACFENFWNSADLRSRYVAAVEHLLLAAKDRSNVVGVDVINEPWPWSKPQFEETVLTAFYEEVQAMLVRQQLDDRLVFQPVIFTSAALPSNLRLRPTAPSIYSPHYYDPLCHEGEPYTDFGRWLMRTGVQGKVAEAMAYGTPLVYGEFGISTSVDGWERFLADWLGLMDAYHLGWVYWAFDREQDSGFGFLAEDGSPNARLAHLVRVYPQRIAGTNPRWRLEDHRFELTYDPIDAAAPTVVFIPLALSNVKVTVNGTAVPWDGTSRQFLHTAAAADGRQRIVIGWD